MKAKDAKIGTKVFLRRLWGEPSKNPEVSENLNGTITGGLTPDDPDNPNKTCWRAEVTLESNKVIRVPLHKIEKKVII